MRREIPLHSEHTLSTYALILILSLSLSLLLSLYYHYLLRQSARQACRMNARFVVSDVPAQVSMQDSGGCLLPFMVRRADTRPPDLCFTSIWLLSNTGLDSRADLQSKNVFLRSQMLIKQKSSGLVTVRLASKQSPESYNETYAGTSDTTNRAFILHAYLADYLNTITITLLSLSLILVIL